MKRHEFWNCVRLADKFFNTTDAVMADNVLTEDEIESLCDRAEIRIKLVYPFYAEHITVAPSPHNDAFGDFAGYVLTYSNGIIGYQEAFEFDFGGQGVDVT